MSKLYLKKTTSQAESDPIFAKYTLPKDFYTRVLGLEVIREVWRAERGSHKLDLRGPGFQLELFSFPDPPSRVTGPEACGLRHLALAVENVEAMVGHLAAHGVACEAVRVDEFTGRRFTFFRDPDGLPLEVYEDA